jgi:hypothetical protein
MGRGTFGTSTAEENKIIYVQFTFSVSLRGFKVMNDVHIWIRFPALIFNV